MGDIDLPPGCVFDFSVTDPEKKGSGAFSYWVYHVHTKTSLPSFKQRKLITVKRYSSFAWLREQLVLEYPGCIIPPIPEKDIAGTLEKVTGSSGPSNLVAYRMRALRKFLVRVGAHTKLQNSDVLHDFLQLGDDEFQKRMKQPNRKHNDIVVLPPTMKMQVLIGSIPETPEYTKWEDTIAYFDRFETLLGEMRGKLNKVMHCRANSGKTFTEFGTAFMAVGEVEGDKADQKVGKMMKAFGDLNTKQSTLLEEQANNECVHVAESLTYYKGMCHSIKDAIRRLIKLQMTRDALKEASAAANTKRDQAPEGEAKQKATEKAQQLETEMTNAVKVATEISEALTEELTRFHHEKAYDLNCKSRSVWEC
eukprot:TRINITY_DN19895_c0_g1_i2.p1 TRINITY_DN19895_c0_g1~~TRINITY_DN19895_c0_g1_i2.p1  ORF type:complete len:365 (+),score=82.88 TRINITY_DN19895_c0_g1_i2:49-1143(+)